MVESTTVGDAEPTGLLRTPSQVWGRRAGLAVLAIAGILVAAGWALRPADRFGPTGDLHEIPVAVGEVAVVGIYHDRAVDITDTQPVVSGDAMAQVEVLRCELTTSFLGSICGQEDLDGSCAELAPAEGRLPRLGQSPVGATQLVVVVTALEPGEVVVEAVDITHGSGWFHRTERTGPRITVTAT